MRWKSGLWWASRGWSSGDSISPWSLGRALGFAGKTAIHPAQIRVIHEVFTPSREEVERARAIVEADRGADGGAVGMGGRMVDRPVVEAARRVLERAGEARRVEGKPDGVGG